VRRDWLQQNCLMNILVEGQKYVNEPERSCNSLQEVAII